MYLSINGNIRKHSNCGIGRIRGGNDRKATKDTK